MPFTADPAVIATDPFFRIKLALLLLAGADALALHVARRRNAHLRVAAASRAQHCW